MVSGETSFAFQEILLTINFILKRVLFLFTTQHPPYTLLPLHFNRLADASVLLSGLYYDREYLSH